MCVSLSARVLLDFAYREGWFVMELSIVQTSLLALLKKVVVLVMFLWVVWKVVMSHQNYVQNLRQMLLTG
jgi:hypothetical protein